MALRLSRLTGRWGSAPSSGGSRTPPPAPAANEPDHGLASEALPHRGIRSHRAGIMIGLVLVLAAVALLVMDRSAGPPVSTLPAPLLEGEPDIYMESAVVSQYRADGSLEYRLEAERASHFQGEATTRLTQPRLTLLHHARPPWIVTSNEGVLHRPPADPEAETVTLEGNVALEQTRSGGDRVRLLSDSLHLYPRRQYAETDQDVMIESLFGRTMAAGLQGDLRLGVLELFSAHDRPVQTILQPEHFK